MTSRREWFTGPLLSRHFAEHVLPRAFSDRVKESAADTACRRLRRWLEVAHAQLGPASGLRALRDVGAAPFFACLGYRLRDGSRVDAGVGASHSVGAAHAIDAVPDPDPDLAVLMASIEGVAGVVMPVAIVPWLASLDRTWQPALRFSGGGMRWAFGFNGRQLRLLDLDRPYARRFLEFDLAETLADAMRARLLWATTHAAAFAMSPASAAARGSRPPLIADIVAACDAHGVGIREALQGGVRDALDLICIELAGAARRSLRARATRRGGSRRHAADVQPARIQDRWRYRAGADGDGSELSPAAIVSESLTLLYRVLFLLFAEARALVPIWHPVYRDSYSIGALQRQAERPEPRGLWEALQAISRLAHTGCDTGEFSMTAFNGQLFSPEGAPLIDRAQLGSETIARVLRALMTAPAPHGRGRERITYADLGVEQLGAVYERILDYAPHLEAIVTTNLSAGSGVGPSPNARLPSHERLHVPPVVNRRRRRVERPSARRKESGTFYTPRGLADALVRDTLSPLTTGAPADRILELRVLDPAMGSGAFLVCACRFLAHAYEQALAREDRPMPATDAARAAVRRTIARRCLFGVDLNPMAVQLARLSLWLTTLTADAPLTFLDHHLRTGDSLIGATMDDLMRRLPAGRRGRAAAAGTLPLFDAEEASRLMRGVLPSRARFADEDDRPETVRDKERLLAALEHDEAVAAWRTLANVWCASWFGLGDESPMPQNAWAALCDRVLRGASALPEPLGEAWLARAKAEADARRFFHWTLEFPEVFFEASGAPRSDGGFDAIVGNPPWDVVRDDARPQAAFARFVRESGVYDAHDGSHPNSYQLFVDRSLALLRPGGRLGLVVPWGLAADHGSARLRRRLLERCDLDAIVSFDNRAGLFPIHRSLRFVLFTCTTGRPTPAVACRFGEQNPAVLDGPPPVERAGPNDSWSDSITDESATFDAASARSGRAWPDDSGFDSTTHLSTTSDAATRGDLSRHTSSTSILSITPSLLRRVSGEGLAFPDVRTRTDLALLERLHATIPALTSRDGWHVSFGRELNITDDRGRFVPADAANGAGVPAHDAQNETGPWPVLEGKHLRPFTAHPQKARFLIPSAHAAAVRTRVPGIVRPRLAYRDVSSPTNRLTLIAAIVPAYVVTTHTIFCLRSPLDIETQHCLCALLNSFVANYLVRMRVSTHVTVALLDRLPVPFAPSPEAEPEADLEVDLEGEPEAHSFATLAALAAQLSRMPSDAVLRSDAYVRLQALAAHAYGLTADEFRHVLSTFPLIERTEKQAIFEAFCRPNERNGRRSRPTSRNRISNSRHTT